MNNAERELPKELNLASEKCPNCHSAIHIDITKELKKAEGRGRKKKVSLDVCYKDGFINGLLKGAEASCEKCKAKILKLSS